jgi:hypothetical protein
MQNEKQMLRRLSRSHFSFIKKQEQVEKPTRSCVYSNSRCQRNMDRCYHYKYFKMCQPAMRKRSLS